MDVSWSFEHSGIDWARLAELYRIAPLGERSPRELEEVFSNSRFKCFAFADAKLVGAGRALADGKDCSCICDVAVHPDYQGQGLGRQIVKKLIDFSAGHRKIILYTNPGKENFYRKLGFRNMTTAMAIFVDQDHAIKTGLIRDP